MEQLQEAWSNWSLLRDHPWAFFVILTFPWVVSKTRAQKTWRVFVSKLARLSQSARESRQKGLPWAGVVESHELGSYHIHALMSQVQKETIVRTWSDLVSPYSIIDVRPFDPSRNALAYMQKEGEMMVSNWFLTGR